MNYKLHATLLLCSSILITACGPDNNTAEKATDAAKEVTSNASGKAQEVTSTITDKAKGAVSDIADKAKSAVPDITDKAKGAVSNVADKAKEVVSGAADKALGAVAATGSVGAAVAGQAQGLASGAVDKAHNAIQGVADKAQGAASGAVEKVQSAVQGDDVQALSMQAKTVLKSFSGELKGKLKAAVKAGGPVAGIAVCHTEANKIANEVSAKNDVRLKRVSLKNRNAKAGLPNTWEMEVLQDFEKQQAAGTDIKEIKYAKIVNEGGVKEFRLMKAIPTKKGCLACHGENVSTEIQAKLKELYPDDKATGFKEGQIRGAFVYTKSLK